jgi:hypothetical protein
MKFRGFPSPLSHCADLDKSVALSESEISDVSTEEASGELAFAEVLELALELAVQEDHDMKAGAKSTDDDWGIPAPVKSSKKTKKGKRTPYPLRIMSHAVHKKSQWFNISIPGPEYRLNKLKLT